MRSSPRPRWPWLIVLLVAGCSRDALSVNNGGDGGGAADLTATVTQDLVAAGARDLTATATVDLAGGTFCSDPVSSRAELNGMLAASPAVSAKQLFLNCCDAAYIDVMSMQLSTEVFVAWRHQVGQGPSPPVTLDLANLPAGWSVWVQSGCTPGTCLPSDRFDTGLSGSLTITGDPGSGYKMSTCLGVAESSADPHPVIHSLRLWVPAVTTQ